MQPGRFITFEGGEGTGKSTQIERLVERLRARGLDVVQTREPGGTPRAETIRRAVLSGRVAALGPFAEALMMNAARDDHLAELIRPALARDAWVVCDRFADSTRAYQGALGGVTTEVLAALEDLVVGDTKPDLTIILDLDPEIALARARARTRAEGGAGDRFEDEGLHTHRKLRQAFLDIAAAEPDRCVVIDASGSADEVAERVWRVVSNRLGLEDARQVERTA
ncbi:dTMP kinase [Tepidamorphus gemmatus]|uniref:Thymidylate kinase n=1 Tax=Tepidamorphus gemmatus TaxID=747076 RepID=A0A4R3MEX4_9HYPH|nr:dTMP kinase [Tepidamorphus gemmatus]TCT12369.1 dTMP kinase [Tepidamorphus gemmatus]